MKSRQVVPQRGADCRNELTASAVNVFSTDGCVRAPIDAVAVDVGISNTTLSANLRSLRQRESLIAAMSRAGAGHVLTR
jgi:hypothetical protein